MNKEERLIKIYQEAQQHLINLIAYKEARGNVTWYQDSLLKQINFILAQVIQQSNQLTQEIITEAYDNGVHAVTTDLSKMGIKTGGYTAFARMHTAAIELLVMNMQGQLNDAVAFVGREMRDNIRQAGLEAIAQKMSTGSTVREAARIVKQKLISQGLKGVRDKRGRMISLDAYASLVARSTTREATNQATKNQLTYNNYDLVKMSSHHTTCAVCAVMQGRVYSISGNTQGYPPLSMAHSGNHANIHPNCRHVLAPYIPALADDAESDKAFSNRPFDVDERSKASIERYNKDQTEKRKLWSDRQQWQRYKLALGADAPKTLSGFRRMKTAGSERFIRLQSDYREFSKQ